MKSFKIILVCVLYFYVGYVYAYTSDNPRYVGGVLVNNEWLIIQVEPEIPIPYFNFYRTTRINDYFILNDPKI